MDDTKFWDKTAPGYVKAPMREGDVPSYEYTMGRSLSYLSAKDKILEIGCGSGATALRFAKSVGHVTASDISPVMIEHANQKKTEEGMQNIAFLGFLVLQALLEQSGKALCFGNAICFNYWVQAALLETS